MKYLSLCSGIEAASVAWEPLGFEPIAFSEIHPFANAVLAHHWPKIPNLGDMENYENWSIDQPDLIVAGTPCQAFSMSGKRKGFNDARGNLTRTFIKTLGHFRPKWFVWENVPGVLSIDKGRTLGTIIREVEKLGYMGAWRVLDASHFGTPQERRRVFFVGHLGSALEPQKVLFECASLYRNSRKSRKVFPHFSAYFLSRFGGFREGIGALRANGGNNGGGSENLITFGARDYLERQYEQVIHARTLTTASGSSKRLHDCPLVTDEEGSFVRRFTPRECERLQGFPDDHTLIPWKNGEVADGHRYFVIGNSMAVSVMHSIGEGIKKYTT